MDKKITIYDIAAKLNISTATVNRALNDKPRVSEETRQLVIKTANEMGFKANKAAVSLARKPIKIGFLMQESDQEYNNQVILGARSAHKRLADFNVVGDFRIADNTQDILHMMKDMGNNCYNGIILYPPYDIQTETIDQASEVLDELKRKGVAVVLVVSDFLQSKRKFIVRNNVRMSGKMAAEFLHKIIPGKPIAMFTAYKDSRSQVHQENLKGFEEQTKKDGQTIVAICENYDDADIAYEATEKLLRDFPDVAGIYVGTTNSKTVCQKIEEMGYGGKIKIIASDIFPELNHYLNNGIVDATIFQEPYNIGRLAFRYLYEYLAEDLELEESILLNPQIVMNSNLEMYLS